MNIGLTYDLKQSVCLKREHPEDALEEYDSPETVQAIARVLESLGHDVVLLGGGKEFLRNIEQNAVDFVFNVAEGRGNYRSREAQVPAVLEMLDIPYSGSDPECLTVCLDKPLTKKIVAPAGVLTPQWQLVTSKEALSEMTWDGFPFPAFVKPAYEGSSKGIRSGSRVENASQLAATVLALLDSYEQPVMVEQFIPGAEVTVGIVGNDPPHVIGIMRVLPKKPEPNFVYSLEVKRDWENLVDYECPAKLDIEVLKKIADYSLTTFHVLGCRDFARLDFRVTAEGLPYFLEINPLAGLNPHSSDLPIMARKVGGSYEALIAAILEAALERHPQCVQR
ncbi:MAG: D-alanine--D-alanine ligase [Chloroflexi bacterium]|nr:D-alanine--D-alanine ligase [Chloroflexota bacterium]